MIKNISLEQAVRDWDKLKHKNTATCETRIGNTFLNFFTFEARLNTRGVKGITFYEFLENKQYHEKPYIKRLIDSQTGNRTTILYRVYTLHCGNISLLKPINAKIIIDIFKPDCVLDFCVGWGSSLVGSCSLDINKFIGIDKNTDLIEPLSNMKKQLTLLNSKTDIELIFNDALLVDYSKMSYDMVFTSPPYYNKEIYNGSSLKTVDEWNKFYIEIFSKTYKHLKTGGNYLLNIPDDVYNNICISLFGECDHKIELLRKKRKLTKNQTNIKTEYIYVWKKLI